MFSLNFLFGSILLGNHLAKGMSSHVRLPRAYFTAFFNYPKRKFSTMWAISLRIKYPQKMQFSKNKDRGGCIIWNISKYFLRPFYRDEKKICHACHLNNKTGLQSVSRPVEQIVGLFIKIWKRCRKRCKYKNAWKNGTLNGEDGVRQCFSTFWDVGPVNKFFKKIWSR